MFLQVSTQLWFTGTRLPPELAVAFGHAISIVQIVLVLKVTKIEGGMQSSWGPALCSGADDVHPRRPLQEVMKVKPQL